MWIHAFPFFHHADRSSHIIIIIIIVFTHSNQKPGIIAVDKVTTSHLNFAIF